MLGSHSFRIQLQSNRLWRQGGIFLHIRGDSFQVEVWRFSVRRKGSKAPSIFFKVDNYVQTNDFKEDKVDFSLLFSLNSKKENSFELQRLVKNKNGGFLQSQLTITQILRFSFKRPENNCLTT